MRNKMEKVKVFVKNNKAKIATVTVSVIGTGIAFVTCGKKPETSVAKSIDRGLINEAWRADDYLCALTNDITIADLGDFGKELMTRFDGLTSESVVAAVEVGLQIRE